VAPLAGALRVPPLRAALAIGGASAVWYGGITYLAFRVGADWGALQAAIGRAGRGVGIAAAALVLVAAAVWAVRRRRA
jgi:membrane protein DedA with SNARE-associated domain